MHRHHQRYKGVDAEKYPKHARRNDAHKFEVHLSNQRSSIDRGSQSTKDTDLVSEVWSLLLGQCNKRLRRALRVTHETKLCEASLREHTRDQRRQIHDAHLANIPCPHSRIMVLE